jgi:hypothetical protein
MSADNGVYILYTDSEEGPEYRVAYSQAIDNIYGKFNDETGKYDGNIESIKQTFSDSRVHSDLNDAVDEAEEIGYDFEYLEDGICIISDFKDYGYLFKKGE